MFSQYVPCILFKIIIKHHNYWVELNNDIVLVTYMLKVFCVITCILLYNYYYQRIMFFVIVVIIFSIVHHWKSIFP